MQVESATRWTIVLAAIVTCAPTARLFGDEPPGEEIVGLRADGSFRDVYINDSFEAADAIAQARRLTDEGRWREASDLLQRTAEASDGKLLRVGDGQYVGVRAYVNERIAAWPPQGLAAYRELTEREFSASLAALPSRHDVISQYRLFERFFCTKGAAELADTIGQLAIEAGDLALAKRVYSRVLTAHPDRSKFRERYTTMKHLVAALAGQPLPPLDGFAEQTSVRWMGEDRPLADILDSASRRFASLRTLPREDEWSTLGGSPDRNRKSSSRVDQLGQLWRLETSDASIGHARAEEDADAAYVIARHVSVHPVVFRDLMFVQRRREIVALQRNTGAVVWRFGVPPEESLQIEDSDDRTAHCESVTVSKGRVFATLPGDAFPYYGPPSSRHVHEIVCLDAATGDVIWRAGSDLPASDPAEISFDSSPVVRGRGVFVLGRRRRSFGFEDCYLYRFNVDTGRIDFRTHLGSASTGTFGARLATNGIVAIRGDTIYACTNLGSIAAVSAHTGTVEWLRLYRRDRSTVGGGVTRMPRTVKSWEINPVIATDDRVYCLPIDAGGLFVLRADTGAREHYIPLDELGGMETLLGVSKDRVCGVGDRAMCFDLAAHAPYWSQELPEGSRVMGRGVWVDDRLFVPTAKGISVFSVETGQRTDLPWGPQGEPGNLLALPDQLIVAGARSVGVYVRKSEIFERLLTAMRAAPSDPQPALEFAEVALRSGDLTDALSALDEAVSRAEQFPPDPQARLARRIFDDILTFVVTMDDQQALDETSLSKLADYAARFSPDAIAAFTYRLRFAPLFEKQGRPERSAALYQQILRDRSLRNLPQDEEPSARTAGILAADKIESLIARYGPSIYAPFEDEASRWFDRAKKGADESLLVRLVDTFPNSRTAASALLALGDLLGSVGRAAEAARRYTAAYHRYSSLVDRPILLRKIADAYEAAGRRAHAYRWLTKALREHPSVRFEVDGRRISFAEYRERLRDVRDAVAPSYPNVTLPLGDHSERELENSAVLLSPTFGHAPHSDWERYYTWGPSGIDAFDSRTGKKVWSESATVRGDVELLVATSHAAILATPHELLALDRATGKRLWSHGGSPRALDDPNVDWEEMDAFADHALTAKGVISVRESGLMTCVDLESGHVFWSVALGSMPRGPIRVSDVHVAFPVMRGERIVIEVLDIRSGARVSEIDTQDDRSVAEIFLTIDEQVVAVTSQTITAFALASGSVNWRITLDDHVPLVSLLLDVDAIFFSPNGRTLRKASLDDGRTVWESQAVVRRGEEGLSVHQAGTTIVVGTRSSISAIDALTGQTVWRGTTPENARLISRVMTQAYVAAVDVPGEFRDETSKVYFYDHRNASGIIPKNGGALELGKLSEVKTVLAVDGALLIQTGAILHRWD